MIDMHLGVSHQAWAVLHHLASYNWSMAHTSVYAYYDGREHGIVLETKTGGNDAQFIAFAEHKSSDDIVVYIWEGQYVLYSAPPSPPPGAKLTRFRQGRVDRAAEHIIHLLEKADPDAQGD